MGATLGGPIMQDSLFFFPRSTAARPIDQADRSRPHPTGVVDAFAALAAPTRTGRSTRTNDARVALGKIDWQASSQNLATVRYNYTWANQNNGTFDVDSWGRSANADENDYSNAGTADGALDLFGNTLQRVSRAVGPRGQAASVQRARYRRAEPAAAGHGVRFREGLPVRHALLHPGRLPRHAHAVRDDNLTYVWGQHTFKAGVEYNEVGRGADVPRVSRNGRYIFSSTDGFLDYLANPNYVECATGGTSTTSQRAPARRGLVTGPILLYLQQAGVGGIYGRRGRHADDHAEGAGGLHPGRLAADAEPDDPGRAAVGSPDRARPDHAGGPGLLRTTSSARPSKGQTFPSDGNIPSDWKMWQPRLGVSYDPWNDGKTVLRGNIGLYYARIPGLVLASTRSTNGSRGQTIYPRQLLRELRRARSPPAYPNLIPASRDRRR